MRFRDSNDYWYVMAPIIVIALLIMISMANIAIVYNTNQPWMSRTYANNICIGIGAFIVIAVVCMFVPIPYKLFAHQYKLETTLSYVTEGIHNKVYAEQDRLWKVLQPLKNKNSANATTAELRFCDCTKRKTCTLPFLIFRQLQLAQMRTSRSRIMQIQESGDPISSFFPVIYSIHKRAMLVQKIDYPMENVDDYRDQIHDLNCHLKRLGLFFHDMPAHNFMVDQTGQLKVIDYDFVLTKNEHNFLQFAQRMQHIPSIQLLETTNIFVS